MNSVVFGSGSPFIIFHFAQRASQTSAAACHVKTLYQALTAPPMQTHTHTVHVAHTHSTCSQAPLPLTVLHMWGTYVVICLTTTPLSTTLHTLCGFLLPCSSLISHLVSNHSSLFFCPSPHSAHFSHMSAVALSRKAAISQSSPRNTQVQSVPAAEGND